MIELLPMNNKLIDRLINDNQRALDELGTISEGHADIILEVVAQIKSMMSKTSAQAPWIGYLARRLSDQRIVGTCAFTDMPHNGQVEIAYFTFPSYEGKGIATEMARGLLEIGRSHGLTRLIAHTLPEENASTSILQRLGFSKSAVITHPEDGIVWQWQISCS